jgi:hypothetical protein
MRTYVVTFNLAVRLSVKNIKLAMDFTRARQESTYTAPHQRKGSALVAFDETSRLGEFHL